VTAALRAFVIGRAGADFPPHEIRTALSKVSAFGRAPGGFGGNVSTGFARLGVPTALLAAVGDDGHGEFIRGFLEKEGIDVRWLLTLPRALTSLAFYEVWPPGHFPVTFYPSRTYWAVRPEDVPMREMAEVELIAVSGTSMARLPLRSAVDSILAARPRRRDRWNILDLDWRPALWTSRRAYAREMKRITSRFDVVIGGQAEFEAASLSPAAVRAESDGMVLVKLASEGVEVTGPDGSVRIPGIEVETVSGLGTGDAFIAAFGCGLLDGLTPIAAARNGNAAGAIVATRHGCSTAMPTKEEVEALAGKTASLQPEHLSMEDL
jgi:5-dehydro-2-deoxygluconokinase